MTQSSGLLLTTSASLTVASPRSLRAYQINSRISFFCNRARLRKDCTLHNGHTPCGEWRVESVASIMKSMPLSCCWHKRAPCVAVTAANISAAYAMCCCKRRAPQTYARFTLMRCRKRCKHTRCKRCSKRCTRYHCIATLLML
jgi:hypothetical protein